MRRARLARVLGMIGMVSGALPAIAAFVILKEKGKTGEAARRLVELEGEQRVLAVDVVAHLAVADIFRPDRRCAAARQSPLREANNERSGFGNPIDRQGPKPLTIIHQ